MHLLSWQSNSMIKPCWSSLIICCCLDFRWVLVLAWMGRWSLSLHLPGKLWGSQEAFQWLGHEEHQQSQCQHSQEIMSRGSRLFPTMPASQRQSGMECQNIFLDSYKAKTISVVTRWPSDLPYVIKLGGSSLASLVLLPIVTESWSHNPVEVTVATLLPTSGDMLETLPSSSRPRVSMTIPCPSPRTRLSWGSCPATRDGWQRPGGPAKEPSWRPVLLLLMWHLGTEQGPAMRNHSMPGWSLEITPYSSRPLTSAMSVPWQVSSVPCVAMLLASVTVLRRRLASVLAGTGNIMTTAMSTPTTTLTPTSDSLRKPTLPATAQHANPPLTVPSKLFRATPPTSAPPITLTWVLTNLFSTYIM